MLEEVLPDDDYRLVMRFQRRDVAAFFKPRPGSASVLAERSHWLQCDRSACLQVHPEGAPLLEETIALARSLETLTPDLPSEWPDSLDPVERALALGRQWEPDFLLLRPDAAGTFRLHAGCICFPSHWSLEEKMGRPLAEIHAPVPGLNEQLGRQIDAFLAAMKPGLSWERVNWGLSRSPERNQHPVRSLPRLDAGVSLEEVWLRIEEQSLVSLPETGGVLFGIRIVTHPLMELVEDGEAACRLHRALATMSEGMAAYKGLAAARPRLLTLLEGSDLTM